MSPYPVTVHFLNTNKHKKFRAEFENIGAARSFVEFAPVTCVNFVIVNTETLDELERHRFEPVIVQPQESEPLPKGDVDELVEQTKKFHPQNEIDNSIDLAVAEVHEVPMVTEQQRRALFGVIMTEYAKQKHIDIKIAQEELKMMLIKRGMISESRTELTKADATKVIDGMLKALHLELDTPWNN